jgi:5-methylcytosine-specific restriction enzyme A
MTDRTDETYFAGYALSRLSPENGGPPECLGVATWKDAYKLFFNSMGAGRELERFANSLKNVRDAFDAHVATSPRVGWQVKDKIEAATKPNTAIGSTLLQWTNISDSQIEEHLLSLIRGGDPVEIDGTARSEGAKVVRISRSAERDPRLRSQAVRIHGTNCLGCGFSFGKAYGSWGENYVEIHHMTPLGDGIERQTDARTDLIPLCANCHRMVHRRPGICLSLEELRALMSP